MGTDSRAAGALLARARTLHLQTGNLLNWGRLRKKCPSTHSEELRDCIQKTLNEWSSQISSDLIREFPDVLECTVSHAVEKINPDEREEMKVSAKLFIVESNSSSSTRNAVDMACSVLGIAQLDSVIIASPPIEDGVNLSLEHLQPYWEELENLVQSKKIIAIGTSDLDKTQLEQLYRWAQVKPNSNQVNLASCCVMPPDLTAFAKRFDIQLLTHNDPKGVLIVIIPQMLDIMPEASKRLSVSSSQQLKLGISLMRKWSLRVEKTSKGHPTGWCRSKCELEPRSWLNLDPFPTILYYLSDLKH